MDGVLRGFVLLIAIIGTGYLAARIGVVKESNRKVLNDVAFYITSPPLLFTMVASSELSVILSPVIVIIAVSAAIVAVAYLVLSRLFFRRDLATMTLGAMSTAYVNSTNLGLPISLYILGDAAYVAPLLLVQQVVYMPIILSSLEASRGSSGQGARGAIGAVARALRNPIIGAVILGFVFAVFKIPIPELVYDPLEMLGAASVPLILISFGASIRGQRVLQRGSDWPGIWVATGLKMIAMPLIAWGLSVAIGLGPVETFATVIFSSLPSANATFNFAMIYGRAETTVRDTVLVTTFLAIPVTAAIALFLAT